mmetsp:Transcript_20048/g.40557  ORF Transcript_20048/g.40557 Transcript_20048/m.40557 type:complete len:209 (-) Transcript_20048:276-902(-)
MPCRVACAGLVCSSLVVCSEQTGLGLFDEELVLHHAQRLRLRLVELGGVHLLWALPRLHLHLLLHRLCVGDGGFGAKDELDDPRDAVAHQKIPGEGGDEGSVEGGEVNAALRHGLELERQWQRDLDHHKAGEEVGDETHHNHLGEHDGEHGLLLHHHHVRVLHHRHGVLLSRRDFLVVEDALVLVVEECSTASEGLLLQPVSLRAQQS